MNVQLFFTILLFFDDYSNESCHSSRFFIHVLLLTLIRVFEEGKDLLLYERPNE